MPRDETVESFRRGLEVIRAFDGRKAQTITEVAGHCGLTRAAARRFLLTLCDMGLARTDGKYFELTPAILGIGQAFLSGLSELEIIRDVLVDLTRRTGESASAAMLDGTEIVYVARSPALHRIMAISLVVGTRLPAHATSMGQALLAGLHPRELERYCARAPLTRFTPFTLTTEAALRARLEEVRKTGVALVSEELEIGLRSVAVLVPGAGQGTRFAINISTQAQRVSAGDMRDAFVPALFEASRAIAMAMTRR
jgi:IclR family transcriptional regulator, pca regulon regulatory protein